MKRDLQKREDILLLLEAFYNKAFLDERIGFFFTDVVPLNLETHIPVIADFWESIVFGKQGYRKNVMEVHQRISHLSTIRKEHLDRWVEIFCSNVDEYFMGKNATLMQQRARSIASLMNWKLNPENKNLL